MILHFCNRRKLAVIVIALTLLAYLFCACIQEKNVQMPQISMKVYLSYTGIRFKFKISEDGILTYPVYKSDITFPFYKTDEILYKTKKLTDKQIKEISILIDKINEDREKINFYNDISYTIHAQYIYATVDSGECISYFDPMASYDKTNALQDLTYMLIDISPSDIPYASSMIRLKMLGYRFEYSYRRIYIKMKEDIYSFNILMLTALAVIIGLLINLVLKKLNRKWVYVIPYAVCFLGAVYCYIEESRKNFMLSHMHSYEARRIFAYLFVLFIMLAVSITVIRFVIEAVQIMKRRQCVLTNRR